MASYYIYTGNNEIVALEKANEAIEIINEKTQQICQANWIEQAQRLTANPVIEGNTYYYGFQAPPPIFINGSTCDLETEFQVDWFVVEEE